MPETAKNSDTSQPSADSELRALLRRMIRGCPLKEPEICQRLSNVLGKKITVFMLDSYTSNSKKPARFPAIFIAPFCEVVGSDALQRHILSQRLRQLVAAGEHAVALESIRKTVRRKKGVR